MAVTRRAFLAIAAGVGAALSPLTATARRRNPYPLHYTTHY